MLSHRRTGLQTIFWVGSIAAVIVVGLIYFPREYPDLSFWGAVYSTLRLFVFERDLDPFPSSWPLIVIYFIAPTISLSVLGTLLAYFFRISPWFKMIFLRDHAVICGMGHAGKTIADALKRKEISIVGIDLVPSDKLDEWSAKEKIPIIYGDFHSRTILDQARVHRARVVIFTSGDDLDNLEGAVAVYDWLRAEAGPVRLIWTHIADERLAETARKAVRTKGVLGIRFFDTYHIAAENLISQYFSREQRQGIKTVYLLGFGKFGRDLFEVLARDSRENNDFDIRVVDKSDRASAVTSLAKTLGVSERAFFHQTDIRELRIVEHNQEAYFLCTDDDLGNVTLALQLAEGVDRAKVYVRMTRWPLSAVSDKLGMERGVVFINIDELVNQGVRDLPGIFYPAQLTDLKRIKE